MGFLLIINGVDSGIVPLEFSPKTVVILCFLLTGKDNWWCTWYCFYLILVFRALSHCSSIV